jgi:hypothetical protein
MAGLRADAGDDYMVREGKMDDGVAMIVTIGKGLLRNDSDEVFSWPDEIAKPEELINTSAASVKIELDVALNGKITKELNELVGAAFGVKFATQNTDDGICLVIEGENSNAAKQEIKQFINDLQKLPDYWIEPVRQLWEEKNFVIHDLDPNSE